MIETKNKTLLTAIALNVIIFIILLLLGDVRYESNDDFSMSNQIADGWYYVSFVNYYLCKFIGFLDSIFTGVNWFILLQVMISFVTLVIVTYIVFDQKKGVLLNALFICVLAFISIDQYLSIQFTKTAALMLICGFLMMFHGLVISKSKALICFGFAWIFVGSAFRFNNLRAAVCFSIAFLGAYSLWYVIEKNWDKQEIKNAVITACKLLILMLVVAGLAYGANYYSKQKNIETQGLKEYREYNKYRANVLDYPLPKYEEKIEMYKKIGFKNHDRMMLKDKYLDYDKIASLENLKYLSKMQEDNLKTLPYTEAVVHFAHFFYNSIRKLRRPFFHIVLLVLMSVMGFVLFKKKWLVFPVLLGAACFLAYIYLNHFGRTVYRAVYIIDLAGMIFLFYSLRFADYKEKYMEKEYSKGLFSKKTAICVTAIFICIPFAFTFLSERQWNDRNEGMAPVDSSKMYKEIMSNKEKTYLISTETSTSLFQKDFKYYKNPYLRQPIMDNYLSLGGWSTKSPYKEEKIKKNGLNNLYSDTIDNDKVIIINNLCKLDAYGKPYMMPYVQNYYNHRYGSKDSEIRFVNTGKVGGFYLWQIKRFKVKENRS